MMPIIDHIISVISQDKIVFSVIGAISILLLRHFLSVSRANHANRCAIGKRIADAFAQELNALIQSNECASLTLTNDAFKRHDAAIRNNIKSLSFLQQFRLNKAWKELAYHPDDKKCKIPFYEQYFSGGSLDDRKKLNHLAICRIQKISSIVS
jgi:hypothetical protein